MMGCGINGQDLDPVSYIIAGLHHRLSLLDGEARLSAMTEMLAFAREPNSNINALLSRYEVVRQRAVAEVQSVMSVEGTSLQILRICNVKLQQLIQLLQPFADMLATNEAQFLELSSSRGESAISLNIPPTT